MAYKLEGDKYNHHYKLENMQKNKNIILTIFHIKEKFLYIIDNLKGNKNFQLLKNAKNE